MEATEQLRNQIAELKAQGESDRIGFQLQLAGVRNVKAARAILADHGGDVDALKEAESWLFADASAKQQGGTIGLPNDGTSTDADKTMKHRKCGIVSVVENKLDGVYVSASTE